jgi:hypothetical protein
VENTCLLCRSHNAYTAELHFGPRNPDVVREAPAGDASRIVNNTCSGTGCVSDTQPCPPPPGSDEYPLRKPRLHAPRSCPKHSRYPSPSITSKSRQPYG